LIPIFNTRRRRIRHPQFKQSELCTAKG
jgi:hypothetical protein